MSDTGKQEERKLRILIVEDDDCTATYYILSLRKCFLVERSSTVAECIERIARNDYPIDAIVLDLNLPNGEGIAVVRRVHGEAEHIPLVVATGALVNASEIINAGALKLLLKPNVSPRAIENAVYEAIALQRVRPMTKPMDDELANLRKDIDMQVQRCSDVLKN